MRQYLDLLQRIMDEGVVKHDRTGVGTKSVFGHQMRFDLEKGFPLLTTKKVHLKSIIYELLWFISGDTNIKYLKDHGVSIWDEWADENGDLGPVYGHQWRSWPAPDGRSIDQLTQVVETIKNNPDSRRILDAAAAYGIDRQDIYVFGDGMNDLEAFHFAGHPIAMRNGNPALFPLAEYVTGTLHEDGILNAVRHYGLI